MSERSKIIFFLGAGASRKAGVPDTFGMVRDFRESITTPNEQRTLDRILAVLKQWSEDQSGDEPRVDIELLLQTLEQLNQRDQDILLRFHKIAGYTLEGHQETKLLEDKIRNFIRQVGMVESDKVRYLSPFLGFILNIARPLDIFSVNYDVVVEQFCNTYKKDYVDGFDISWNLKQFDRSDVDIRLYKLHGSIIWYRTDRGSYVKIPIRSAEGPIKLATGEQADTFILYPQRKWDYPEPLLELMMILKKKLEEARIVFVIGYSIRDDPIQRMFLEAAIRNLELNVVLIGPGADDIYHRRLKYIAEPIKGDQSASSKTPSGLSGRTICLPYKFEDIFPLLKDKILPRLREGLRAEEAQLALEISGSPPDWVEPIEKYIICGHMEKVEELISKAGFPKKVEDEVTQLLKWTITSILNYGALGQQEKAVEWNNRLSKLLTNELVVQLNRNPSTIRVKIKTTESATPYGFDKLSSDMRTMLEFISAQTKMISQERLSKLRPILDGLQKLQEHAGLWAKDGAISMDDYIKDVDTRYRVELEKQIKEYLPSGESREGKALEDMVGKIETENILHFLS